ncbi:MAG: hypothetical protein JWO05_1000 [Gemmatimonadetes bacterium]|nr:hypothetical protein [Gemmatimonadota bacterium]
MRSPFNYHALRCAKALLVLALAACVDMSPDVPTPLATIVMDSTTYTIPPNPPAAVYGGFTLTNTSSAPIALATCGGMSLPDFEVRYQGTWRLPMQWGCVQNTITYTLQPGESRRDSVYLLFVDSAVTASRVTLRVSTLGEQVIAGNCPPGLIHSPDFTVHGTPAPPGSQEQQDFAESFRRQWMQGVVRCQ